jgi:hypothetical protein
MNIATTAAMTDLADITAAASAPGSAGFSPTAIYA